MSSPVDEALADLARAFDALAVPWYRGHPLDVARMRTKLDRATIEATLLLLEDALGQIFVQRSAPSMTMPLLEGRARRDARSASRCP